MISVETLRKTRELYDNPPKLKIYLTPLQAQWCKRVLDFDPAETDGYVITKVE